MTTELRPSLRAGLTRTLAGACALIDRLAPDRARRRSLAADVIRTDDRERALIAHRLHDSTAQTLAAIMLQLSAAARESRDDDLAARLELLRELAGGALEDVRTLALTVYPRVLDDLGLAAALESLAREAGGRCGGVTIAVECEAGRQELLAPVAVALYRVAQEGVSNAIRHGAPHRIDIRLAADERVAQIEIIDDGRGFDARLADQRHEGLGLFAIRERVALLDGRLGIVSRPGYGTRLAATVPLATPRPAAPAPPA